MGYSERFEGGLGFQAWFSSQYKVFVLSKATCFPDGDLAVEGYLPSDFLVK